MFLSCRPLMAAALLSGVLACSAPAWAINLTGAWASDASRCDKIFKKSGNRVSFTGQSEIYGSGFIVDGNQIRGKSARCAIKSRREDGSAVHLLASCSTDIMLSSVQFSLRIQDDNTIARFFPEMPDLDLRYYRCSM